MRTDIVKDLIIGNTRWWGPIQKRQYHKLLGYTNRIGVEWEAHVNQSIYDKKSNLLSSNGFESKSCSKGTEWAFLFDTTNPFRLVNQIKFTHSILWMSGMNTLGGVHVNIQTPVKFIKSPKGNVHNDIIGDNKAFFRTEYKEGYPYLHWWELLLQFGYFSQLQVGKEKEYMVDLRHCGLPSPNQFMPFVRM